MKKFCIIICSLLVAMSVIIGIASNDAMDETREMTTLCDMDYEFVSY